MQRQRLKDHREAWQLYRRGSALLEAGAFREAADAFAGADVLFPGNDFVLTRWGKAVQALGHHHEAIRLFTAALRHHPPLLAALVRRSASYEAVGDSDKAEKDLEAVLRINPDARNTAEKLRVLRESRR